MSLQLSTLPKLYRVVVFSQLASHDMWSALDGCLQCGHKVSPTEK